MRIYDRNNKAPRQLSGRMDLMLCSSWFVYIMISTLHWLPDLVYDLYRSHGMRLMELVNSSFYTWLESVALIIALVATTIYLGYLGWCRRQGYYISFVKLTLMLTTFVTMYLTYVPNTLMRSMLPQWSFAMGFAALGMVHVAQYLAIVWKYNRQLAKNPRRVRAGWFARMFAFGGPLVAIAYLLACLGYGFLVSSTGQQLYLHGKLWFLDQPLTAYITPTVLQWLLAVLAATNFTSTLLHYYYDGFIWKVRHKENQQALGMQKMPAGAGAKTSRDRDGKTSPTTGKTAASWNDQAWSEHPAFVILRQSLYFVLPMVLLGFTFWNYRLTGFDSAPLANLRRQSHDLFTINKMLAQGQVSNGLIRERREIETQILLIMEALDRQLVMEEKMLQFRPRAQHYSYIAELLAQRSEYRFAEQTSRLGTTSPSHELLAAELPHLRRAIKSLEQALESPPPYTHREFTLLNRLNAQLAPQLNTKRSQPSEYSRELALQRIEQLKQLHQRAIKSDGLLACPKCCSTPIPRLPASRGTTRKQSPVGSRAGTSKHRQRCPPRITRRQQPYE